LFDPEGPLLGIGGGTGPGAPTGGGPGGGGTPGGGGPEFQGGIFHDDLELPDVGDVGPLLLELLELPTPGGGGGGGPPDDPPQLEEGGGTPNPLPDEPQCPGGRGIPGGPRDGPPDVFSDGGGRFQLPPERESLPLLFCEPHGGGICCCIKLGGFSELVPGGPNPLQPLLLWDLFVPLPAPLLLLSSGPVNARGAPGRLLNIAEPTLLLPLPCCHGFPPD